MTGKPTNVKISKERFREMFIIRKTSEIKVGKYLQDEINSVSYRQFQRNLHDETMKSSVLNDCARLLDCDVNYLKGITNLRIENINPMFKEDFEGITDSKGFIFGHYFDPEFTKYGYDAFYNWVMNDTTIHFSDNWNSKEEFAMLTDAYDIYEEVRDFVITLLSDVSNIEEDQP